MRAERTTVVRAGTPEPATRLWVQPVGGPARSVTPTGHYVDGLSWSPDGREIAYSASSITGFLAPYYTRIYAVAPDGTGSACRSSTARGMNTQPQFSPDGASIAFVTTNEQPGIIAPRGLAVVEARSTTKPDIRSFSLGGAWIGEMLWARDSRSIFALMNEGTFATGAHMFEMPVVRIPVADGKRRTRRERRDRQLLDQSQPRWPDA